MNSKILIGIVALVLISGIGSTQAFATHFPPIDEEDEIFDNGRGDEQVSGIVLDDPITNWADDFILEDDAILTDVHFDGEFFFITNPPPRLFDWKIYLDDDGVPGQLLKAGVGINEGHMEIEPPDLYRFWFDLDNPVALKGGQTYWLSIDSPNHPFSNVSWLGKSLEFGNTIARNQFNQGWVPFPSFDLNFILTGEEDNVVVGGELLPIDSTLLLLAGAQSTSSWLIPVIVAGIGIGLVIIRRK